MTEHRDAETLATAKTLTAALNETAAEVKRLRAYGRRNRKYIVFDIVITILLAVASGIAVHASQSAHNAQVAAVAAKAAAKVAEQDNRNLCESGNVARAQQVDLWNFAIGLGAGHRTAQQQEATAKFEAHLRTLFAARNCGHPDPRTP
jgi:hypothetical protein